MIRGVEALITNQEKSMAKRNSMTKSAAKRIQSHADRTGRNQGFKSRAQSTAAKSNTPAPRNSAKK
jgi:hypothetical protein